MDITNKNINIKDIDKISYSKIVDRIIKEIIQNSEYLEEYNYLKINIEDIINNMNITKLQKEKLYKKIVEQNGYNRDDYYINWDKNNIKGIILRQPLEYMSITIDL